LVCFFPFNTALIMNIRLCLVIIIVVCCNGVVVSQEKRSIVTIPPAEADYKLMTPYPPPPVLPESSQTFVARDLLDVLTQRGRNRNLSVETVRQNLQNTQSGSRIEMSTAMHPDAIAEHKTYHVIADDDDEFVMENSKQIESPRPLTSLPSASISSSSFGAISNPAAYYLRGAAFDSIVPPKCHLLGCDGPYPNDGNVRSVESRAPLGSTCQQSWIALNGCVGERGYPVGMLCTICCECGDDFNREMHKSRGFIENW